MKKRIIIASAAVLILIGFSVPGFDIGNNSPGAFPGAWAYYERGEIFQMEIGNFAIGWVNGYGWSRY
jgi:hypothetical protein